MRTVKDIYDCLDGMAPFSLAEPWDNSGLLVGNMGQPVSKAVVTLDVTADILRQARQSGAELIVSHHPAIFQPVSHFRSGEMPYELACAGISCISAHTNFDRAPGGTAQVLAQCVGLSEASPLAGAPYVLLGLLPEPMSGEAFLSLVQECLSVQAVRFSALKSEVRRVAVCPGCGDDFIADAARSGADVYLTADLKYHKMQQGFELGMMLVDAGHYETEIPAVRVLRDRLADRFPDVDFFLPGEEFGGFVRCYSNQK